MKVSHTHSGIKKMSHLKCDILKEVYTDRVHMMHSIVSLWEQLHIVSSGISVTLFSYTYLPRSW